MNFNKSCNIRTTLKYRDALKFMFKAFFAYSCCYAFAK